MKWVLILQLCFIINGQCLPPGTTPDKHDNYTDCLQQGLEKSLFIINNLDPKEKDLRPSFTINCQPVKEEFILPKKKPKIETHERQENKGDKFMAISNSILFPL
jgi:hypothetical protein